MSEMGCSLAGPGRGDCMHFVGLPGKSIPNQHDGPDDTVDDYGKPNGWCWSCWKDYKLEQCEKRIKEQVGDMKELIAAAVDHDDPKRVLREFMAARPELFGERKP